MKYWWVNQNQTSEHEIEGSYLWSPKLAQGGRMTPAYENMKNIEPGDVIFSYHDMSIAHYGIATNRAMSSPKPQEFGRIGSYWSDDGWYVSVKWIPIGPVARDVIGRSADRIFDAFESPFTVKSTVKQAYLFQISKTAADFIMTRGSVTPYQYAQQVAVLEPDFFVAETRFDDEIEKAYIQRTDLANTEKETIILARRGQGRFRENLSHIEKACRITKVDDPKILVASHIKPWRACDSIHEKLDGNNGLLLTPTMDRLFDHRYMTFKNDGTAVLSKKIAPETYVRIGLDPEKPLNVGTFNKEQCHYLEYHQNIFLG
jgi:putative restriction endonuclease